MALEGSAEWLQADKERERATNQATGPYLSAFMEGRRQNLLAKVLLS